MKNTQIWIPFLFLLAVGAALQTHNPNATTDTLGVFQLVLNWKVWALICGALICVWFFTRVTYPKIQAMNEDVARRKNLVDTAVTYDDVLSEERSIACLPFPDKMRAKYLMPRTYVIEDIDYKIVHYRGHERIVWFNTTDPRVTKEQAEFSRWWINTHGSPPNTA